MLTKTLTKELAQQYSSEIIQLHNLIPFQNWTEHDLFKEEDERRLFVEKWKISSVSFAINRLVGICISFVDNQSVIQNTKDFIYLHRIAVLPEFRFKGIGSEMIKHTCKSFINNNKTNIDSQVIVSTPIKALNNSKFENAEQFYIKLGFEKIDEKKYASKIDSILKASISKLI